MIVVVMETIEERAREYILNANNIIELPARRYGCSIRQVSRAYIAGATEQKAIDIDKAKKAFNKVCGWLSTYPWYNEVFEEFIKEVEE